jgi:tRNA A37 methylthiotransferase MiaB
MGRMDGQVTLREKNRRRRRVMEAQQRVVMERNQGLVAAGAEVECIVESRAAGGRWHGRTSTDAPGIDGTIRLPDLPGLVPGAMGRARVVSARGYDLEGAWVGAPS